MTPRDKEPLPAGPTDRARSVSRRPAQAIFALASGLLVMFAACGFCGWFSGAASWTGFYLGARGKTLVLLAQSTAFIGFALAVVAVLAWYRRQCRRGDTDIPWRAVVVACVTLPLGCIFWAVFVDAVAYHYGSDIVRPAFDVALMYLVLGSALPLGVGVPCLVGHLRTRHRRPPPNA